VRTGAPVVEGKNVSFEAVEDVPDIITHSDEWCLEYSRDPHLRMTPIPELRTLFQRTVAVNSLAFVKGSWPKQPDQAIRGGLRIFTHVLEETNRRGIDIRLLNANLLTTAEKAQVYAG
jgi:hypothetical protein